jgi:gluconokinase
LRQVITAPVGFVLLATDPEELLRRMSARTQHYMPPSLLSSQLDTLERPQCDELAITLDALHPVAVSCGQTLKWLLDQRK